MYDYRCKNCENLGQCMSMMNMPMMNMTMMNMPMGDMNMENMPIEDIPMGDMPMMSMPMGNMPMMNMPMGNMPMMNMPMMNMPMMNMPMMNMPMMNMPMIESDDESDEKLKNMYPKIYIKILPMVKHHCDMMVAKHGKKYCPSKEEMDCICKEISDKYKEHYRGEEEVEIEDNCSDDDDNMRRRRRYGSGGGIGDIARILIIGTLLGGRSYNYGY